ncbi:MAG: hypothetical protein CMJ40_00755 [Phycisphaerae bacterium]|nr:hypothetical protein [Phycisphaerae bacterium]|tara:strand:+ start:1044 stop:1577 length:534 start_codon:yes stop_codon:yes gene_type:complete
MTGPEKRENNTTKGKGPGPGCLLLVALVLIGGSSVFYGGWQIWSTVSNFEQSHLDEGYELLEGKDVVVSERIEKDTYIYARHSILIENGANANLALSSHDVLIKGTVEGNVAFLGSDIEIAENGIINGNLNVTMAKNVVIRGQVDGAITGTWTRLYENSASNPSDAQSKDTTAKESE